MFEHNIKLAWRQLIKYRLQSFVSIVSLAIGFACFALASMWIKYETTYDASFKDAENLYVILRDKNESSFTGIDDRTLRELPQLEQLSYIENVYSDSINGKNIHIVSGRFSSGWVMNDTNFVELFGLDMIEGSASFVHNEQEIAISDWLAKYLWPDESPIGKEFRSVFEFNHEVIRVSRRVSAVFRYWGEHSNFPQVHYLCRNSAEFTNQQSGSIFARISPRVDMEALNAHLDTMPLYRKDMSFYNDVDAERLRSSFSHQKMKAVPITKMRHSTATYEQSAQTKINHIYLFAIAGGMLIACGLLNYLTMFINRLFIRQREIALRTVFGATGRNLMMQFLTEYGLLLVIALLVGLLIIGGFMKRFLIMTELPLNESYFYGESLIYLSLVFVVSMLVSTPAIWYFRRQSLQSSISGVGGLVRYHIFRRISTGIQIGISILCIFCTVVLTKQLDTLRHGDIGFERENRMVYTNYDMTITEEILFFLRQCPEVDTSFTCAQPIYPVSSGSYTILKPNHYPELTEAIKLRRQPISDALIKFYGLTLMQGRWLRDGETEACIVNEAFVHQMGWENPLAKRLNGEQIVGVVKNFYNVSPTIKPESYILIPEREYAQRYNNILVHYKPGMKQALMSKIESFFKEQGLNYEPYQWRDAMEEYSRMLVSEDKLKLLISITTSVCILIALFGVWSMIMLTCEQRRKEIAVRKVFGATTKDILDMFIVEYMALQGVAALVAFPIGYACMKPWLEQYVVQTEIPWWIYVGIFLMVALLVALCVGWRVWKTATAHPADEICKG